MAEGYNGWTNYETWCVNLWLDNDGSANYLRDHVAMNEPMGVVEALKFIGEYVEELQESLLPDMPNSMFSDLLGAAISQVNWYEIAEYYLEDAEEVEA